MADNFYAKYPSTGSGSSGVTSLNTLTGALTLAAGSGITITPSGGDTLTIAASGGGGANTALSNLITTAINQNLTFDTGADVIIQTKDDVTAASKQLFIKSGDAGGFASGAMIIASGGSDTAVGALRLASGAATADDIESGIIDIETGSASGTGTSGPISMGTGNTSGTANTGDMFLFTGDSAGANSGNIVLQTGAASGFRGAIIFNDNSLPPAQNGYVWTLADQPSGVGGWAAPTIILGTLNFRFFGSTSTITGADSPITYDTADYDSVGTYTGGVYTVPVGGAGRYQVNAALLVSGTIALNDNLVIEIVHNSTVISQSTQILAAGLTSAKALVSDIIALGDGDTLSISASSTITGAAIQASDFDNYLSVCRIGM